MGKKIISWIILLTMVLGTFTPAMPAYAAEQDPAAEIVADDGTVAVPVLENTQEGDFLNEDGNGVEAAGEEDTAPADEENGLEETPAVEDADEAFEEETQEDLLTEEEFTEEAAEDAEAEEELLTGGDFWDDYKGEMGYMGPGLVTFEPEPEDYNKRITVFASRKADKKNPVKVGTVKLKDPTIFSVEEDKYLESNGISLYEHPELLPGTWTLYSVYEETGKPYAENEFSVTIFPAPGKVEATSDAIIVTREAAAEKSPEVFLYQYGDGFYVFDNTEFNEEGIATITKYNSTPLTYGTRYYVAYGAADYDPTGDSLLMKEGTIYFQSPATEVTLKPVEAEASYIKAWDRITDKEFYLPAPETLEMYVGDKAYLQASVRDEDDYEIPDQSVTWTSSNTKVFTVDGAGIVTAKAAGEETLTVKSGKYPDVTLEIPVKVENAVKIKKMSANPARISTEAGEVIKVKVTLDAGTEGVLRLKNDGPDSPYEIADHPAYVSVNDGKAEFTVQASCGGVCTITATADVSTSDDKVCELKTITIPFSVDGLSGQWNTAWVKGKQISGWVAYNGGGYKITKTGKPAITAVKDLYAGGGRIQYFDPETMQPVKGLWIIDKKYRYFNSFSAILAVGMEPYEDIDGLMIDPTGEVLTGWIEDGGSTYYYDPYPEKDTWIYDKAKKGSVFVDKDGKAVTGSGLIKLTKDTITEDELFADATVCLKNGVLQKGWVYFDKDGNIATKAKAASFIYADPDTGIVKTKEFFRVSGKLYYAGDNCIVKTGYFSLTASADYYADKNGVIAENKVVTEDDGTTHYAGKDGVIEVTDSCLMAANGKLCIVELGEITAVPNVIKWNGLILESEDPVYIKSASTKPADGLCFYSDDKGKNKVKNAWLCKKDGSRLYYLDGSGKPVGGIAKAGGPTYYFDPDTLELHTFVKPMLVEYKNKKYWIETDGKTAKDSITFHTMSGDKVVLVKKDGQPESEGLFNEGGRKLPVGKDGYIVNEPYAYIKGKWYVVILGKTEGKPNGWNRIARLDDFDLEKEGVADTGDRLVWLSKDGSIKGGWFTDADKKKYYQFAIGEEFGLLTNGFYIINGKLYHFDENGVMTTGWLRTGGVKVTDLSFPVEEDYTGTSFCFYFDEKSGAAATGWKTMNAPAITNYDTLVLDEDGQPVDSNVKKKIYFVDKSISGTAPMGALAGFDPKYPDLSVGGKIYRFRMDGSPVTDRMVTDSPYAVGSDYLLTKDGSFAKGRTKVGNDWYYFNQRTGKKEKDVFRLSGGKWYYYGNDGKMSTNGLADTLVYTECKPDGSIIRFMDGSGRTVTNQFVWTKDSADRYLIGPKGLPLTGLQRIAVKESGTNYGYFYCDSDGSLTTDVGTYYTLVKSGKKIYVVRNGKSGLVETEMDDGNYVGAGDVFVDYSRLPAADQEKIGMLIDMAISRHLDLEFITKEDGSLASNEVLVYGGSGSTFPVNAYGIATPSYSMFCRIGSDWTIYMPGSLPGTCVKAKPGYYMEGEMMGSDMEAVEVIVSINEKGALNPIRNKKTGAALNGCYFFESDENMINLKNGLPATGWQKINYMGATLNLYFDPEGAIVINAPLD